MRCFLIFFCFSTFSMSAKLPQNIQKIKQEWLTFNAEMIKHSHQDKLNGIAQAFQKYLNDIKKNLSKERLNSLVQQDLNYVDKSIVHMLIGLLENDDEKQKVYRYISVVAEDATNFRYPEPAVFKGCAKTIASGKTCFIEIKKIKDLIKLEPKHLPILSYYYMVGGMVPKTKGYYNADDIRTASMILIGETCDENAFALTMTPQFPEFNYEFSSHLLARLELTKRFPKIRDKLLNLTKSLETTDPDKADMIYILASLKDKRIIPQCIEYLNGLAKQNPTNIVGTRRGYDNNVGSEEDYVISKYLGADKFVKAISSFKDKSLLDPIDLFIRNRLTYTSVLQSIVSSNGWKLKPETVMALAKANKFPDMDEYQDVLRPQDIKELLNMTFSKDEEERRSALDVLTQLKKEKYPKETNEALKRIAAKDPKGLNRRYAFEYMQRHMSKDFADFALKRFFEEKNDFTAQQALATVFVFHKDFSKLFLELAKSKDKRIKSNLWTTLDALLSSQMIKGRSLSLKEWKKVQPFIFAEAKNVKNEQDAELICQVLRSISSNFLSDEYLTEKEKEEVPNILKPLIESPHSKIRNQAIWTLRCYENKKSTEALKALLNDPDKANREDVILELESRKREAQELENQSQEAP